MNFRFDAVLKQIKDILKNRDTILFKRISTIIVIIFFGLLIKILYIPDKVEKENLHKFINSLKINEIKKINIYRTGIKDAADNYKYAIDDRNLISEFVKKAKEISNSKSYSVRFNQLYYIMLIYEEGTSYTFLYNKQSTLRELSKRDHIYHDVGQLGLLKNTKIKEKDLKKYPDVVAAFYHNGLISFLIERADLVVQKNPKYFKFNY